MYRGKSNSWLFQLLHPVFLFPYPCYIYLFSAITIFKCRAHQPKKHEEYLYLQDALSGMEVFQDHFALLTHLSLSNIPLRKCNSRLRIRNWSPFRNQHPAGTTARSLTRSRGQAVPRPKFLSLWGGGCLITGLSAAMGRCLLFLSHTSSCGDCTKLQPSQRTDLTSHHCSRSLCVSEKAAEAAKCSALG